MYFPDRGCICTLYVYATGGGEWEEVVVPLSRLEGLEELCKVPQ